MLRAIYILGSAFIVAALMPASALSMPVVQSAPGFQTDAIQIAKKGTSPQKAKSSKKKKAKSPCRGDHPPGYCKQ